MVPHPSAALAHGQHATVHADLCVEGQAFRAAPKK